MGPPDIRVGNRLYLLDRGSVPFALRPVKYWATKPVQREHKGPAFEVAAECYVHGIMDGEALTPPPVPTSKQGKRYELRRKLFGGQALDDTLPLGECEEIGLA